MKHECFLVLVARKAIMKRLESSIGLGELVAHTFLTQLAHYHFRKRVKKSNPCAKEADLQNHVLLKVGGTNFGNDGLGTLLLKFGSANACSIAKSD